MHASVRRYRSSDVAEVGRRVNDGTTGFLPVVRQIQGLRGYYLIDGGGGTLVTVTVCSDEAGVDESVEKAREWVSGNAADLVEGAPDVINGEVIAQS